jgi:hypothetical protein
MTSDTEAARLIDLSPTKARSALLKSESYSTFELPLYFDFDQMLRELNSALEGKNLSDLRVSNPGLCDDVNHTVYHSKDGKYAWRPMELIHPALYVSLAQQITSPADWGHIQQKFAEFALNPKIECSSHPLTVPDGKRKDKAKTILSWWQEVEQRSLALSLEYDYVIQTDVSDCYGSIYTHSIPWALHGKPFAKENRFDKALLGNRIDKTLRACRQDQTNGIPQGSALMNLIAEIVLGYSDTLLSDAIAEEGIEDYFVLRYRDDYRIFTNNPADAETITKLLAVVLQGLGMKLSPSKTSISDDIITTSIKEDKMHWIGKEKRKRGLLKHLLLIHELAREFPNSGSVVLALTKFQNRISKIKKTDEGLFPMIGVLTDITVANPRVYPHFAAILSKLIDLLGVGDQERAMTLVLNRFERVPYSGHVHIWMQRFSLPMGYQHEYREPLCKTLSDPSFQLWNSSWIGQQLQDILKAENYVDQQQLQSMGKVISSEEVQLFDVGYY